MRFEDVYVAGSACWLPEPTTVDEAERSGLCERRHLWRTEYDAVCIAAEESAPEMAANAARAALQRAGCAPDQIDLILHADTTYQGQDLWPPASYVQRVAVGNRCPAIEVRQMSNGGLAALDLAAGYVTADPARSHALVTTGDRFVLPGYDRWRSDPGTVCGDGGTAAVLSTRGGHARLRSIVTMADSSLERMHRGADPFGDEPFSVRKPIDLDTYRREVVSELGLDAVLDRITAGQQETVKRALSDAEAEMDEIDWFVLPHLGRPRLKAYFLDPFGIDVEHTTWRWGRRIGHLGAGDQIAGLTHLMESGEAQAGQRCLLAGVGGGFSWSAAVVELLA